VSISLQINLKAIYSPALQLESGDTLTGEEGQVNGNEDAKKLLTRSEHMAIYIIVLREEIGKQLLFTRPFGNGPMARRRVLAPLI
jgi:hypothetical protein